jgi:hypothetical protein
MNKKKSTLNEYVNDRLTKSAPKEDLEKILPGDLDKNEGDSKGFRELVKPAVPGSVKKLEDETKEAKWDDELFQKWIDLRTKLKKNKNEKDWRAEINVCEEIIQLDSQAKFINIMIPLFYKDMAKAYEKLEDIDNTLKYYHLAKEGLLKYRNEHNLNSTDEWLNDINNIDERILKLSGKDAEGEVK